jgi:hypothetical protein
MLTNAIIAIVAILTVYYILEIIHDWNYDEF